MIVKKIEIKNNVALIYLSDNTSFSILADTYLTNTILLNKELTKAEIEELLKQDNLIKSKKILLEKLSRKKLSKIECKKILLDYGVDGLGIDKIVEELEHQCLINDIELGQDIINYCLVNKKGRNVIKEKLNDRGIFLDSENFIESYIDEEKYVANIEYLINKYKKLAKDKSKAFMKQYLREKMQINGYNIEEFNAHVDVNDVEEYPLVVKEIEKFFKNREKNKENIAKITKKLLSKGFNYDIIKKALGSVNI